MNIDINLLNFRPFNPDDSSPWEKIRRCALKPNGEVYKYHDNDDTNRWEDGTPVDWEKYYEDGLNCMVEIPKFYYKKLPLDKSNNYAEGHIWMISDKIEEGFKLHPAFKRCRNKDCDDISGESLEVDYRYRGAFLSSLDKNNRLRSLPNKLPITNLTISEFRNFSKNNGVGWGILDYNLLFACQLLYSVEYGNYDSQSVLGKGYVFGNSKIKTGGTLEIGNHSTTTNNLRASYRGIEDIWGNCYYFIDGFICNNDRNILIGDHGFNINGNGYKLIDNLNINKDISGYIGNIIDNDECGYVIQDVLGSDKKGLYDKGYLWANCLPIAGGYYDSKFDAGIYSFDCSYNSVFKSDDVSANLVY